MAEYTYKMPSCGHPRHWSAKQCRAPRWYWFQLFLESGESIVSRKQLTWNGACQIGDAMFASTKGVDCMFLIDGRVPKEELEIPPIDSIWNRWERSDFIEDGKPCVLVQVRLGGSIAVPKELVL